MSQPVSYSGSTYIPKKCTVCNNYSYDYLYLGEVTVSQLQVVEIPYKGDTIYYLAVNGKFYNSPNIAVTITDSGTVYLGERSLSIGTSGKKTVYIGIGAPDAVSIGSLAFYWKRGPGLVMPIKYSSLSEIPVK